MTTLSSTALARVEGPQSTSLLRTESHSACNDDWQFHLDPVSYAIPSSAVATHNATPLPAASASPHIASFPPPGAAWTTVHLPHWGVEQPYDISTSFQGLCWYRRLFHPTPQMQGRRLCLEFGAGMQQASLYVNRKKVGEHAGGYLPFFIDLTEAMTHGIPVEVTVRLDNRDNPQIPPGKPQNQLDFCYFPGLYRDVFLHVTDKLYLTDAVQANRVAQGGIFVRYEDVSPSAATVWVSVDIANEHDTQQSASALITLRDQSGVVAGHFRSPPRLIASGRNGTLTASIQLMHPKLWSLDQPHLYSLQVELYSGARLIAMHTIRMGVRTLHTDPHQGFFLNGQHLVPSGTNRHQMYPYIGNALSDEAQYRDARLLKDAGFQLIRLCHYPQSPAFLDACDELGMLVIECIPGWQFFNKDEVFLHNVRQNLRDLIRRDRNHPSAALWECSLNETSRHDDFIRELVGIAHEEYPGDQMLTCGDVEGHDPERMPYNVPYSGWDEETHSRPSRVHGDMSLHREYGDNQFGGYSRYSRGDGERLMLVQAWNYQTALNEQLGLPYTWGQCAWEAIDTNRGMSPDIMTCGALDPFRLPKFLYFFFQSQRDPHLQSEDFAAGPMIFIANDWTSDSPRDVVVFSNCDEVELQIGDRLWQRRTPDSGPDVKFGDSGGFNLNYWLTGQETAPVDERKRDVQSPVYNGGNCRNLPHPPFTFSNVPFAAGKLRAIGYLKGAQVAETVRATPQAADHLEVLIAANGCSLSRDGSDLVFIHAHICDAQGTTLPHDDRLVHFKVEGPATLVGDNSRKAEAGIASILLRSSGGSQPIRVEASAHALKSAAGLIPFTADSPTALEDSSIQTSRRLRLKRSHTSPNAVG